MRGKRSGKAVSSSTTHTRMGKKLVGRKRQTAKPRAFSGSYEELMVKKLVRAPEKPADRGLQAQDLIYSSAPELRSLAFKAGFNLGAEAYRSSPGSIAALEHLMENAGFGRMIYHPLETKSVFTSSRIRSNGINLGANVHIFEAGVISGYLTAHAKSHVTATETECVFNGFPYCRFTAVPGRETADATTQQWSLPSVIIAMEKAILASEKPSGSSNYYLYSMHPLLEEPLFSEAQKFLYLLGKLLSQTRLPQLSTLLPMVANFLRITSAKVSSRKNAGMTLGLVYGHDIASWRFVDLTTALISGIVKGSSGKTVRASRSAGMGGVYNVKIENI